MTSTGRKAQARALMRQQPGLKYTRALDYVNSAHSLREQHPDLSDDEARKVAQLGDDPRREDLTLEAYFALMHGHEHPGIVKKLKDETGRLMIPVDEWHVLDRSAGTTLVGEMARWARHGQDPEPDAESRHIGRPGSAKSIPLLWQSIEDLDDQSAHVIRGVPLTTGTRAAENRFFQQTARAVSASHTVEADGPATFDPTRNASAPESPDEDDSTPTR